MVNPSVDLTYKKDKFTAGLKIETPVTFKRTHLDNKTGNLVIDQYIKDEYKGVVDYNKKHDHF